ncbi:MAG TPA: response regulator [Candidatus Egerieimonas faecigallinarum]|nr:response regulator [Candidatus Egerieimonas faecigallinarum]
MYHAVIVDDEPFVLDGLKAAIDWEGSNFEIAFADTNPLNVLSYIKSHPVDLLITDISMPEMSGLELILEAKAANSLLSVLVLSAYDNFEYVRTALRNGAENYLLKPLDSNELLESIRSIAEHLRERTQLSNTYGSTMLTFRSLFTENWVKGSLGTEDFLTRAELLGINLSLNNYTVLLFSSTETDAQGMARLFDWLLSVCIGKFQSHFYFETPTCLVCILSSIHEVPDMEAFMETLRQARPLFPFRFFVSVGNTVDNYEDVSDSYRNAHGYLFLRHTGMQDLLCTTLLLPLQIHTAIEQSFSSLSKEEYIRQLLAVFTPSLDLRQRMAVQLTVLNHGLSQLNFEQNMQPELMEKLRIIPPNARHFNEMVSFLQDFISICYALLEQHQSAQSSYFPFVDAVIQAVHEFSNKDISLKTLASQLNMHPSYLGNVFHQQTGYYFNDYLNEERLKYAAGLLEDTELKMKEIVDKAGFSSQTYFNRLFKRKYGASPLAYRREMRSRQIPGVNTEK